MFQPNKTTMIVILVAFVVFVPLAIIGTVWNELSEGEARADAQQRGFTVTALRGAGVMDLDVSYGDTGCTAVLHYGDKEDDPVTLEANVPVPGSAQGVTTTLVDNPTVKGLRSQRAFAHCFVATD